VAVATALNRPPANGLWETTQLLRQVIATLVAGGHWPGVSRMAG
jgi:hypothetical protein